ncbi:MAG: Ig-like domain-containing protein, partial [Syntrophales bacterium]
TTVAATESTPPTVSSTSPTHASAQTGVAITVAPTITFSEAIAPATVTATSVYISTSATDNTGIVTASVAMANGNTRVVITPTSSLAYNTAYYLHVTTAVTDANSNAIAAQFNGSFSFTTIASGAPVITSVAPSGITNVVATITWTTDVTSTANIVEYGLTTGLGTNSAADVNNTAHSVALSSLTADRIYYYRVKSTAGGSVTYSDILSFTTSADTTNIAVDGITMIKSYATADATYANGWKWAVNISVWNTAETNFKLKLTDFASGSNTIAISGNVRVGLTNEATGASDATIEAATEAIGNAFTDQATALTLVDSDPNKGGIQDTVYLYVQVPVSSAGGSYTSSYGIQTL